MRVAWMDEREVGIIEDLLATLRPKKCLEWGSGFSTAYFSRLLGADARWLSIEHEAGWAERVRKMLADRPLAWRREGGVLMESRWHRWLRLAGVGRARNESRARVVCVPPDRVPFPDAIQDGTRVELGSYIDYPDRERPFDFILVDGRARKDCVIKALDLMSDHGVVVLHDAKRKEYEPGCLPYPHQELFADPAVAGYGLWLGAKRPLAELLDLPRHRRAYASREPRDGGAK